MNKNLLTLTVVAALAASAAVVPAQSSVRFNYDGHPERLFVPAEGLSARDRKAMKDAALSNMMEIKAAEIAQRQGSSAWTRQFAKDMEREHTLAHEELRLIADSKGMELPGALPRAMQLKLTKLSQKRGAAFDRAYHQLQIDAHEATSMKLKSHLRSGRDEDVKAYLVKTIPAVNLHLRLAKMEATITGPMKPDANL
jgi:putative membrane protein